MNVFSEFRTLILCAFILLVAGCVTTTPFTQTETVQEKSLLYIFRPDSLLSRGSQVRVDINDQTKGVLINKSYIAVQVDPGKNTVTLLVNDFINNTLDSMVLQTTGGTAYFIKAEPGVFGAFSLVVLDEETGMREVSATDFYQTN
jgi:hypothetical protein